MRIVIPNGAVLGVVTLTNLEVVLKVLLLLVTIGYTCWNWYRKWKRYRRDKF